MILYKSSQTLCKALTITTASLRYFSSSSQLFRAPTTNMNSKRTQPPWSPPPETPGISLPKLTLFNSLTGNKERFIPEKGRDVQWYCCGPTVYDASHMGHARSYITFDILRRVLRDYFNFNVKYVMNITDIDDKIIKRARQNYLFDEYAKLKTEADLNYVVSDIKKSMEKLKTKFSKETDPDKKAMLEREIQKITAVLNQDGSKSLSAVLSAGKDALSDYLDSKFGTTVTSNDIFRELPQHFENEFHKDMEALNIQPADILIRVSDVVPEVVDYCQKIIDNGFGYESNGSVYFDTIKFSNTPGHFYAKLVPTAFGDQEQLQEGEGVLTTAAERIDEKRSQTDFALWKASKPGEPGWDSPWGRGRPGWHIECSVMASSACGSSMDIHTGGVDLKFPHHDNELAQAESYFGHSHWVRYFLHAGHLTISGCKMSKSLKNFITIREALAQYSARRLRIAFLLHSWKDTLDYSDDTMTEAVAYERMLLTFFFTVRHYERIFGEKKTSPMEDADRELEKKIKEMKSQIEDRLCDSVDTRGALNVIQEMVSYCNLYIRDKLASSSPRIQVPLLKDAAQYVTKIFRVFGCGHPYKESNVTALGFEDISTAEIREVLLNLVSVLLNFNEKVRDEAKKTNSQSVVDLTNGLEEKVGAALGKSGASGDIKSVAPALVDELVAKKSPNDPCLVLNPLLTLVATHREGIRGEARRGKMNSILQLSDQLRDESLPQIGVRLEDPEEGQLPLIGLMNRALLEEERAERLAADAARNKAKNQQRQAKEQQAAEKSAQMRIPPWELFRKETDKYSKFDERGMPTHDAAGNPITKSQLKKLQKVYDQQQKKYNEYQKTL